MGPSVDLNILRRSCAPLIAWYERFLAEGRVEIGDLDEALVALRSLPPMGGRLGRAVALLLNSGADASAKETVAALELLRTTTGLRTSRAPAPGPPRRRPARSCQLRLPGVD